jgi:hypothetical protein
MESMKAPVVLRSLILGLSGLIPIPTPVHTTSDGKGTRGARRDSLIAVSPKRDRRGAPWRPRKGTLGRSATPLPGETVRLGAKRVKAEGGEWVPGQAMTPARLGWARYGVS